MGTRPTMPQRSPAGARRVGSMTPFGGRPRGPRVESRRMSENPPMDPRSVMDVVRAHRLVAVIRAANSEAALGAARAVVRGGIRLVEVTYSVPEAPAVMRQLVADAEPGVVVGAGTVLTAKQAADALAAGARFLIAPNVSDAVSGAARDAGAFYCPGAYTTGEI